VIRNLVLLPGLDGTGQLFDSFLAALPNTLVGRAVAYPENEFFPYDDLLRYVQSAIPRDEPFVLLAESFSAPIAVEYAASNPQNLAALIIVAGFIRNPLGSLSLLLKLIIGAWIFKVMVPRWVLERVLMGSDAPTELVHKFRHVLHSVSPAVLSGRVHEALRCDVSRHLARTNIPLMYVHAMHDGLLSEVCLADIKHIRPDISVALVDGPHLLLQRKPQDVANIVSSFIRNLGC
jgi:pimeloyl-[acyl-carrier protein] methyl ester esterase